MYLVTGGAGFIGSNIVRKLLDNGQKVRVLDDFSTGKKENLVGLKNIEVIEGSLSDYLVVQKALNGIKYVLHQGAIPSVLRSIANPIRTNDININGTLNLLAASNEAEVKRIVFAASSSVYGDTEILPKTEKMIPDPLSPYAVSKYAGELYSRVYSNIYGLQTVSLRYFNIFGPYQDPNSEYAAVIPKFINSMLNGKAPTIYGDGEQTRDFIYIENAVIANLMACESDMVGNGEIFNIASGEMYSLNQLVDELNSILKTSFKPVYVEPVPGDVKHSLADIAKAKNQLGYKVAINFREGLERTIEWFRRSK